MKRSTPLKRKTPLCSRGNTKYRRRPRDLEYMKLVRKLPCIARLWANSAPSTWSEPFLPEQWNVDLWKRVPHVQLCGGRIEADHAGVRGLGQKSHDTTTIPCCSKHHGQRTDLTGMFKGWTKYEMRAWCDWAIAHTQQEVARLRAA